MTRRRRPRIALALAGGGPLGAIHEIGALCALDEALDGLHLERLDHYVGVSAGAFLAAGLANGMSPRQLCAAFIENQGAAVFDPAWLMVPAWGEFAARLRQLPALALAACWECAVRGRPLGALAEALAPALPTGLFSNELVHTRLGQLLDSDGHTNDFRRLRARLTLVATDLDTAEAVRFGDPGWDHVPISRAVQASAALPGLFPPVRIDGHDYVDGALRKTVHASVALEGGADLLLCLNPLVPFHAGATALPRLAEAGLVKVLGQAMRTMLHSRMTVGMQDYAHRFPGADIVLLEPDRADPVLYAANTFGYRQRRRLAEHAYQQTRTQLLGQRATLGPLLARHGVRLRVDVLRERRHLVVPPPPAGLGGALRRLHATLDDLQQTLPAA